MWQVGPAGSARTSSASTSQSLWMLRRRRTLPLVSPFVQYSERLRLQNVTSCFSSVRRRASASM